MVSKGTQRAASGGGALGAFTNVLTCHSATGERTKDVDQERLDLVVRRQDLERRNHLPADTPIILSHRV